MSCTATRCRGSTTWTAEEIVSIVEDGHENDEPNLAWVSDTPTEEREVLFLG